MKLHWTRVGIVCAGSLLAGCLDDSQPEPATPVPAATLPVAVEELRLPMVIAEDLRLTRLAFGILRELPTGEVEFVETTDVPPAAGQAFGWRAEVETTRDSLQWEERLQLPTSPESWGDAEDDPEILISDDGRTAIAHGVAGVEEGRVERIYWQLDTGDPAGEYLLEVALEGRLVGRFQFRLAVPVGGGSILVRQSPQQRRHAQWS